MESELGKVSTFTLRIPLERMDDLEAEAPTVHADKTEQNMEATRKIETLITVLRSAAERNLPFGTTMR